MNANKNESCKHNREKQKIKKNTTKDARVQILESDNKVDDIIFYFGDKITPRTFILQF